MFEKPLIIVGIDPGTTVGYAILDIEGRLLKIDSSKEFDLSSLISKIIEYGKVLAVGTDKQRTPGFVNDFAIKIGGIIISPKEDIKVEEKEQLTKEFEFKGDHQQDALASAIFAYRRLKPLLNKISEFVKHNKKENLKNKITEIVVKNYGISIKSALDIIEKPTEYNKIIKKVIETKQLKESDFFKLNERLRFVEDENRLLKAHNSKIKNELDGLLKQKEKVSEREYVPDKKLKELLKHREIRLNFMSSDIISKDNKIKKIMEENKKLLRFLALTNESILLKKLDNLGSIEFENKKNILNIKDGDVLLVKDLSIISQNVYETIKEKVNIIVCKEKPSKKIKEDFNFIFIDENKLDIEEDCYFALVDKKKFEKSIESEDILKKVVIEYRSTQP